MKLRTLLSLAALAALSLGSALGRSSGPPAGRTGAPGEDAASCTACHAGSLNSGAGSVKIVTAATYTPGAKQHIVIQLADAGQKRWGFQLSARASADNTQAGSFAPVDTFTKVICANGAAAPCADPASVQYIEQTSAGTRNGTADAITFEFDWTAPATDIGPVSFYVAGNAANGDGTNGGDHIYTAKLEIAPLPPPPASIPVAPTRFNVSLLTSDLADWAPIVDPNLRNPWGIALGANTAFWVSNYHASNTTVYNGSGALFPTASPLVVAIPAPGGASSPTGQVYNPTKAFELAPGVPAAFLFATAQGTVAGWNRNVDAANAITVVDRSSAGASYTGLALASFNGSARLYAANFSGATVDVFDSLFQPVTTTGGFTDPDLPAGYAPHNVYVTGRSVIVAYALQNDAKSASVDGDGNGLLNVFDLDGTLRKRLVTGGPLNGPWGMAIAPAFFGDMAGSLLVGNFGDGKINAIDLASGDLLGPLTGSDGNPLALEGLWGLQVGNGKTNGGDSNTLYFTAGVSGGGTKGDHGVFGSIAVAPAN